MLISWHVTLGNDPCNLCRYNIARRVESKIDLKPATHLAILYADRRDRRKSAGVPGAAIAIFADHRDRRIKSPKSGLAKCTRSRDFLRLSL